MTNPYGNYNQNSPWPVYGSGAGAENGQGTAGQVPAQNSGTSGSSPQWGAAPTAPGYGTQPTQTGAQPGYSGVQSGAYAAGQMPNPGASDPNSSGVGGANYPNNLNSLGGQIGGGGLVELPSRAGSIWLLVIGIVMMVVLAPATFFVVVVYSAFGWMENSEIVYSGDTVNIADGTFSVMSLDESPSLCVLIDDAGDEYRLSYDSLWTTYSADNLTPGSYVFSCEGYGQLTFVTVNSDMQDEMLDASSKALIGAAILGIVGLVLTIFGIVKLVKVNGERRLITMQQMQNSGFGNYPY